MPMHEVDRLDKSSSSSQSKAAMSACIQMQMNEGKPQDQAVAICTEMVKSKMGGGTQPPAV